MADGTPKAPTPEQTALAEYQAGQRATGTNPLKNAPTQMDDLRAGFLQYMQKPDDPAELQFIFEGVENSIIRSFGRQALLIGPSGNREIAVKTSEVRLRTQLCLTWWQHARRVLGYTVDRAIDMMPQALQAAIDNDKRFDPPKATDEAHSVWRPQ
jgi:hypothetical protein